MPGLRPRPVPQLSLGSATTVPPPRHGSTGSPRLPRSPGVPRGGASSDEPPQADPPLTHLQRQDQVDRRRPETRRARLRRHVPARPDPDLGARTLKQARRPLRARRGLRPPAPAFAAMATALCAIAAPAPEATRHPTGDRPSRFIFIRQSRRDSFFFDVRTIFAACSCSTKAPSRPASELAARPLTRESSDPLRLSPSRGPSPRRPPPVRRRKTGRPRFFDHEQAEASVRRCRRRPPSTAGEASSDAAG